MRIVSVNRCPNSEALKCLQMCLKKKTVRDMNIIYRFNHCFENRRTLQHTDQNSIRAYTVCADVSEAKTVLNLFSSCTETLQSATPDKAQKYIYWIRTPQFESSPRILMKYDVSSTKVRNRTGSRISSRRRERARSRTNTRMHTCASQYRKSRAGTPAISVRVAVVYRRTTALTKLASKHIFMAVE